jgi:hypothetical protein
MEQAPGSKGVQDAIGVLEGTALFGDDAQEQKVFSQHAYRDGKLYLDLADEGRHIIEIGADGGSSLRSQCSFAGPIHVAVPSDVRVFLTPLSFSSFGCRSAPVVY